MTSREASNLSSSQVSMSDQHGTVCDVLSCLQNKAKDTYTTLHGPVLQMLLPLAQGLIHKDACYNIIQIKKNNLVSFKREKVHIQ